MNSFERYKVSGPELPPTWFTIGISHGACC